jgi:hypothetical protein
LSRTTAASMASSSAAVAAAARRRSISLSLSLVCSRSFFACQHPAGWTSREASCYVTRGCN